MRTFKENYSNNLKDKKGKQELSKNLDVTYAVMYVYYVVITIRTRQHHSDIDKSGEEERVVGWGISSVKLIGEGLLSIVEGNQTRIWKEWII